jgi:hypothetical protein
MLFFITSSNINCSGLKTNKNQRLSAFCRRWPTSIALHFGNNSGPSLSQPYFRNTFWQWHSRFTAPTVFSKHILAMALALYRPNRLFDRRFSAFRGISEWRNLTRSEREMIALDSTASRTKQHSAGPFFPRTESFRNSVFFCSFHTH